MKKNGRKTLINNVFIDIVGTEVRCSGVLREIAYTVLITNDVFSQTTGDISILKVVDIQVDVVV